MRILEEVVWGQEGDDGVPRTSWPAAGPAPPAEESRAVRRQPLGPCASLFTKSGSSGGRGGGVEDGTGGIGLGHRKKTGNDHYGRKAENLEA